jgi:hypothetical protein
MLLGGIGAELALLLLLIYTRPLSSVFGLDPLGLQHCLLLCTFGPLVLLLEEGRKAVSRYASIEARTRTNLGGTPLSTIAQLLAATVSLMSYG